MTLPIDFDFCNDKTVRCKAKASTDMIFREGEYFGNFFIKDTRWALVLWDHEEDPNLYKADLLLIENRTWMPVQ